MPEYERSRQISVPAQGVFAFVSDVGNLSTILPNVRSIQPAAADRVRVKGETHGRSFEDAGWFHVDEARRRLEWGSDEGTYRGWLTVAGTDGAAQVVVHLSVPPHVDPSGRPLAGEVPAEPDPVEAGLEAALDSLRNVMEGRGGKEQPGVVA